MYIIATFHGPLPRLHTWSHHVRSTISEGIERCCLEVFPVAQAVIVHSYMAHSPHNAIRCNDIHVRVHSEMHTFITCVGVSSLYLPWPHCLCLLYMLVCMHVRNPICMHLSSPVLVPWYLSCLSTACSGEFHMMMLACLNLTDPYNVWNGEWVMCSWAFDCMWLHSSHSVSPHDVTMSS